MTTTETIIGTTTGTIIESTTGIVLIGVITTSDTGTTTEDTGPIEAASTFLLMSNSPFDPGRGPENQ